MARPRKLTPELRDRLATWIRAGNPIPVACKASGIVESTFHDWMDRGRRALEADGVPEGEEPFVEFLESIERAMDETEAALVAMVTRAAQRNGWQAAAWILERRWPERWGKPMERLNGLGSVAAGPAPAVDPFEQLDVVTDELAPRRRAS